VLFGAFRLGADQRAALQRDVKPLSGSGSSSKAGLIVFLLFALFVVLMITRRGDRVCDEIRQTYGENSNEARQCEQNQGSGGTARGYGGSFGGYSTGGGGHK
jgi:uncharacterized membrane protein YgcG